MNEIATTRARKRCAVYCRVSTADQSCERQERDLLAYAERAGFEVVGIWKETASGRCTRCRSGSTWTSA